MKKLKITLACAGGVSTSMLCKKIVTAAKAKGFEEVECNAYAESALKNVAEDSDIILIGPQIAYRAKAVQAAFPQVPVEVIAMRDYGAMNGEKIFSDAYEKYQWQ